MKGVVHAEKALACRVVPQLPHITGFSSLSTPKQPVHPVPSVFFDGCTEQVLAAFTLKQSLEISLAAITDPTKFRLGDSGIHTAFIAKRENNTNSSHFHIVLISQSAQWYRTTNEVLDEHTRGCEQEALGNMSSNHCHD